MAAAGPTKKTTSCSGCAHCLRHALIDSVTRWLDAQNIGSLEQLRETYPQFWGDWERPGVVHRFPMRTQPKH
jgi:hypothetical protein